MCTPALSHAGVAAGERIPVRDGTESFDLGFLNRKDFQAAVASPAPSPAQYHSQRITTSQIATAELPEQDSSEWRDEVASRVQAHRARRRRRFDPEASLSLGFEAAVTDEPTPSLSFSTCVSTAVEDAEIAERVHEIHFDSAPQEEHQSEEDLQAAALPYIEPPRMYERIAMRNSAAAIPSRDEDFDDATESNVIEFPRFTAPQDLFTEELAESIIMPRILDVPDPVVEEEPPPLATIRLDEDQEIPYWVREYEEADAELELPLQVAPLAPRLLSGVVDAVLVLTAAALFSMIVLSVAKFVPQGKTAMAMAVLLPAGLWAIYQYVFLVFAGITPGMMMSQLELSSFEGCVPLRKTRASRAFAMMLCCVSLGMGFAWAMVDEDNLGWHDRMTRTYLRQS
jgi:uncharacterized RDD family membrane protein YckC